MGSKRKNMFGETIEFTEIFSRVIYVDRNDHLITSSKLYEDGREFPIVEPVHRDLRTYFPAAYRKVVFQRMNGSGIIIGQTKKSEGMYHPGSSPTGYFADPTDFEQAYVDYKWTYTFWVVATDLNKTVLVLK